MAEAFIITVYIVAMFAAAYAAAYLLWTITIKLRRRRKRKA